MVRHKVAVYADREQDKPLAELCIASIREHMPDAEIWHLTTLEGPTVSADQCLRMGVEGPFAYRQAVISGALGEALFLDVDVVVKGDVSEVWNEDFDVALATDMKPGAPGIKYNHGVVFVRNPDYWKAVEVAVKNMDFYKVQGDWEPIERTRGEIAETFNLKVLPGEVYNYIPSNPEDVSGKLVHYRGKRKTWMHPINGFETSLNTPMETMIGQAEQNLHRDLPLMAELEEHAGTALIVGGGPSLAENIGKLRFHKDRGGVIFALNATHDWLIERGIIPDFHVLLDARKDNAAFVRKPHKDVTYLIASQCHPDVFEALEGYSVVMWTACFESFEQEMEFGRKFPGKPIMMVGGGATVGMKAMYIAYLWGFRKLHMFGMDSSYRGDENHAYRQTLNDKESRMTIHAAGRDFVCAPWMAKQAMEFQGQYRQLAGLGCRIKTHGDGLIPWITQQLESANV